MAAAVVAAAVAEAAVVAAVVANVMRAAEKLDKPQHTLAISCGYERPFVHALLLRIASSRTYM